MPSQTANMAAQARGSQARVGWIDACPELDEYTPALSGWRVGLAAAVVAAVLALLALPVLAVLDPPLASRAAGWLGHMAAVAPLMTGVRALAFVVAVAVISRSDARP